MSSAHLSCYRAGAAENRDGATEYRAGEYRDGSGEYREPMMQRGTTMSTTHIVVMGISGSGKSTVAAGLVRATGYAFAEADEFHPKANVAKMAAGHALNDQDRWPWLQALADWMTERAQEGTSTVMACSALRRSYRDVLRSGAPEVLFVHVDGSAEVIRERMNHRDGHFMPASLLDSQIATLEPLQADERGVVIDVAKRPEGLGGEGLAWLHKG